MNVTFTVFGTPTPQGSMKAFMPKGWSRPVLTGDNSKTKRWKQQVAGAAFSAMEDQTPTPAPVDIHLDFYFVKPKSSAKRVLHKITKPDIDKLERSVLDALTGIVFADGAQVLAVRKTKQFGTPERVEIKVFGLPARIEEVWDGKPAETNFQEKLFA